MILQWLHVLTFQRSAKPGELWVILEEDLAINFEQSVLTIRFNLIQTVFSSIELWKHNFESISTRIVFGAIFSTLYI